MHVCTIVRSSTIPPLSLSLSMRLRLCLPLRLSMRLRLCLPLRLGLGLPLDLDLGLQPEPVPHVEEFSRACAMKEDGSVNQHIAAVLDFASELCRVAIAEPPCSYC